MSLTDDCLAAKAAGVSYGVYKATQVEQRSASLSPSRRRVNPYIVRRYCKTCGVEIPQDSRRKKYCSDACKAKARQRAEP